MRSFLQVYSRLLKKYFNFIFCEVSVKLTQGSVTRACVEFSWNLLFCNIFPPWTAYDLIVNMTFRICIAFANLAFQFANKLVRWKIIYHSRYGQTFLDKRRKLNVHKTMNLFFVFGSSLITNIYLILNCFLVSNKSPIQENHPKWNHDGETKSKKLHYVKSFQIRSSFWSVFSRIRTEYGEMRENTDQKKLGIWTLFTQCYSNVQIRGSVPKK